MSINKNRKRKIVLTGGAVLAGAAIIAGTPSVGKATTIEKPVAELRIKKMDDSEHEELGIVLTEVQAETVIEPENLVTAVMDLTEAPDFTFNNEIDMREFETQQQLAVFSSAVLAANHLVFDFDLKNLSLKDQVLIHNEAVRHFEEVLKAQYQNGEITYEFLNNAFLELQSSYVSLTAAYENWLAREAEERIAHYESEILKKKEAKELHREAEERRKAEEKEAHDKLQAERETEHKAEYLAGKKAAQIKFLEDHKFLVDFNPESAEADRIFDEAWALYEAALAKWKDWNQGGEELAKAEALKSQIEFLIEHRYLPADYDFEQNPEMLQQAWQDYEAAHLYFVNWDREIEQAKADEAALIAFLIAHDFLASEDRENPIAIDLAKAEWQRHKEIYDNFDHTQYAKDLAAYKGFISPYLPDGVTFEEATAEQRRAAFLKAEEAGMKNLDHLLNDEFQGSSNSELTNGDLVLNYEWGASKTITSPSQMTSSSSNATELLGLGIELFNDIGSQHPSIRFTKDARAGFYEFYYQTTGNIVYVVVYLSEADVEKIANSEFGWLIVSFDGGTKNHTQAIMANPKTMFTAILDPGDAPKDLTVPDTVVEKPIMPNLFVPLEVSPPEEAATFSYDAFTFVADVFVFNPAEFTFEVTPFLGGEDIEILEAVLSSSADSSASSSASSEASSSASSSASSEASSSASSSASSEASSSASSSTSSEASSSASSSISSEASSSASSSISSEASSSASSSISSEPSSEFDNSDEGSSINSDNISKFEVLEETRVSPLTYKILPNTSMTFRPNNTRFNGIHGIWGLYLLVFKEKREQIVNEG
ncbi:MAG: hypothetical protein LBI13_00230 [Streptococcaceae bacterium]|nr:hypothetical protein [Streptococcaceae bacterium]